jgi:hypothetical protein
MRGIASTLGSNLASLLDQLAARDVLQEDYTLAQNIAVSVRDMLDLVKVLQVDTLESEGDGKTAADMAVPAPTLTAVENFQIIELESTCKLHTKISESHTPQSRETTFGEGAEGQSGAFHSSLPSLHQKDTSSVQQSGPRYQNPQNNRIHLNDWFSAKYLFLDRALDPYNLHVYKEASLAERIEHSALVRAGWLLQDPTTTMDLVYKIFPFDKSPAPPHIQLFKIKQLISRSHPNLNRQTSSTCTHRRLIACYLSDG